MSLSLSLSPGHNFICKKRAESPNFPFSSVLFVDLVTKTFFVTIHSVGLEILCDEFLGHSTEKCQLATAIEGRVPLNFGT